MVPEFLAALTPNEIFTDTPSIGKQDLFLAPEVPGELRSVVLLPDGLSAGARENNLCQRCQFPKT
jgi:hypothetical protein